MPKGSRTFEMEKYAMIYSTDEIWRGSEEDRCLTDDLNAMESDIADLEAGKAPANHSHSGYAPAVHEHTGFADAEHSHSEYAETVHTHEQSEISGLIESLAAKAPYSTLSGKADLVDGKVPAYQLPSFVDDVVDGTLVNTTTFKGTDGNVVTPADGKIYNDTDDNKSYRWSGSQYVALNEGVVLGETASTAYRGDRGKVAYDHSQNGDVHVTAAQKEAWSSKAEGNHDHAGAYIPKSLQFTSDLGGMEKTFYVEDNTDLIAELEALTMGFHTVYSQAGVAGNPNAVESFRCFIHKPSSNIMWVLAFGTTGSMFTRYWNGGTWHNWREIYSTGKVPTAAEVGAAKSVAYGGNGASTYKKVWIAPTGSDDNPGTSASPMATITGAIRKYSEKHKMLDISLADGTYNEDLGAVSPSLINLAIRSNSENKDAVTINMTNTLEVNVPIMRMYNITLVVAATGVRPISVTGGTLYAYNVRINVPTNSGSSCVNVYNGCSAVMMHCVLNSGTSGSGAALYGNQANIIKAINCTSERKVSIAFYAHNGTTIIASDTINATTKIKKSYYGKVEIVTE